MDHPKYQIFKGEDGQFWFHLMAGNGKLILKSEGYTAKHSCQDGIQSVKTNALQDTRYQRKVAKNGQPFFNLTAPSHEIIGTSETYSSEHAMETGIAAVKHDAPAAPIEDLTHAV